MTDAELAELARALRFDEPARADVEQMRTAVLATMPARWTPRLRPLHGRLAAGACVAAVAIGAWIATRPPGQERGTITTRDDAQFVRVSASPNEIVRLFDGTVHVEVTPLRGAERFIVVVGDGQVEVRGTAFDVEVHRDHLARVRVIHGRVEVRSNGVVRALEPGEQWDVALIATARLTPVVAPTVDTPIKLPEVETARPRSQVRSDNAEQTFRHAFDALSAGDAATAAAGFAAVIQLDRHGALLEDAEFWRGAALARARRTDAAEQAYATFLADFPQSVRAGQAAVLIGWIRLDANDLTNATSRFTSARHDPSNRVRASAEQGLDEVERRRTHTERTPR